MLPLQDELVPVDYYSRRYMAVDQRGRMFPRDSWYDWKPLPEYVPTGVCKHYFDPRADICSCKDDQDIIRTESGKFNPETSPGTGRHSKPLTASSIITNLEYIPDMVPEPTVLSPVTQHIEKKKKTKIAKEAREFQPEAYFEEELKTHRPIDYSVPHSEKKLVKGRWIKVLTEEGKYAREINKKISYLVNKDKQEIGVLEKKKQKKETQKREIEDVHADIKKDLCKLAATSVNNLPLKRKLH